MTTFLYPCIKPKIKDAISTVGNEKREYIKYKRKLKFQSIDQGDRNSFEKENVFLFLTLSVCSFPSPSRTQTIFMLFHTDNFLQLEDLWIPPLQSFFLTSLYISITHHPQAPEVNEAALLFHSWSPLGLVRTNNFCQVPLH